MKRFSLSILSLAMFAVLARPATYSANAIEPDGFGLSGDFIGTFDKLPDKLPTPDLSGKFAPAIRFGKIVYLLVFEEKTFDACAKVITGLKVGQKVKVSGDKIFPILGAGIHPEFHLRAIESQPQAGRIEAR